MADSIQLFSTTISGFMPKGSLICPSDKLRSELSDLGRLLVKNTAQEK